MNRRNPPPVARWMLEHLTLGYDADALTGDIAEEFLSGHGRLWYWRQVFLAIAVGFLRQFRRHRSILGFALLWSLPAPALMLSYSRFLNHSSLIGKVWAIPWPWSTVCGFVIDLGPSLAFLWIGMALYLALHAWIGHTHRMPKFGRGVWVGFVAYTIFMTALLSIPHAGRPIDIRTVTMAFIYSDPWFLLMCAPGFLSLAISIWSALPRLPSTLAAVAE
ncbi:MAG: hypothetical protein WBW84_12100 [Acidobacteriaceae bacterium]